MRNLGQIYLFSTLFFASLLRASVVLFRGEGCGKTRRSLAHKKANIKNNNNNHWWQTTKRREGLYLRKGPTLESILICEMLVSIVVFGAGVGSNFLNFL